MKKSHFRIAAIGLLLFMLPLALHAHHSFAAEFDASKVITLTGTVNKIAWTNPHAHIQLDVSGQGGKVTSWNF
jgi:hypothetical protein